MVAITHTFALALALTAYSAAFCKKFTKVGSVQTFSDYNQRIAISNGIVCTNSTASPNCVDPSGFVIGKSPSCAVTGPSAEGLTKIHGFTNLSLPIAQQDQIFSLISNQHYLGAAHLETFHRQTPLCITPSYGLDTFCIPAGKSGFLVAVPELKCISGTFDECGANDHVKSGTAVKACGIVLGDGMSSGGVDKFYSVTFHYTNASVAAETTFAPRVHQTKCGAATALGLSSFTMGLGLIAALFMNF